MLGKKTINISCGSSKIKLKIKKHKLLIEPNKKLAWHKRLIYNIKYIGELFQWQISKIKK